MYLVYECIFQLQHKSTGTREFSTKIRAVLEAPLLALQLWKFSWMAFTNTTWTTTTLPASHDTDWLQSLLKCGIEHFENSIQTHTIATTEFIRCTWLQGGGDLWTKHVLIPLSVQYKLSSTDILSRSREKIWAITKTRINEKCSQHHIGTQYIY